MDYLSTENDSVYVLFYFLTRCRLLIYGRRVFFSLKSEPVQSFRFELYIGSLFFLLVFLVSKHIMQKDHLFLIVQFMVFFLSYKCAYAIFDDLLVIICQASFIFVLCVCMYTFSVQIENILVFFLFVNFFAINHKSANIKLTPVYNGNVTVRKVRV
jgi:hypothetical protein